MRKVLLVIMLLLFCVGLMGGQNTATAASPQDLFAIAIYVDGKIADSYNYQASNPFYECFVHSHTKVRIEAIPATASATFVVDGISHQGNTYEFTAAGDNTSTNITISAGSATMYLEVISVPNPTPEKPAPVEEPAENNNQTENNNGVDNPEDTDDDEQDENTTSLTEEFSEQYSEAYGQAQSKTTLLLQIDNAIMEVNNLPVVLDAAPFLLPPGHTLVPVRFIAEALGGVVGWNEQQQRVDIWLDGISFTLYIGQLVPGTNISAMIKDSRTYVPLRYVMESFGASVTWYGEQKYIFIIYPA